MAKWDKISSRGNVSDRRGAGAVAGVGITGVLLMMGVTYLLGGDPLQILMDDPQVIEQVLSEGTSKEEAAEYDGLDQYELFVSTVLGSNNDYWKSAMVNYVEPELVLFRGSTQSACGGASSVSGPHYCPADKTIYLDETFFDQLEDRLGAQGGDVAEAYVIGHEVGHHVQNITGQLGDRSQLAQIAVELTADCYAGLWANSIRDAGVFLPGEINEAQDAAAAVGDDSIQKRTTGTVSPESWTHGSSQQRVEAFNLGYDSGSLQMCNNKY